MQQHSERQTSPARRTNTPQIRTDTTARPGPATADSILALQRSVGNAAVNRALGPVQRVADAKEVLTNSHWQARAGNNPPVAASAGGSKRDLDDVIKKVAPDLLERLRREGRGAAGQKQLKLYRTMDSDEAEAILAWKGAGKHAGTEQWLRSSGNRSATAFHAAKTAPDSQIGAMPVKKHLGDWEQAHHYYKLNHDRSYDEAAKGNTGRRVPEAASRPSQRTLEFTLKPGAHEVLFSPDYMAPASEGEGPANLRRAFPGRTFQTGSGNEGGLPGYVGMKSEQHGDFSLHVGSNTEATQLLFQMFLQDVRDVTPKASRQWHDTTDKY
ncbi:hypothetical protein [Catenulispora rubra]|uniref:hypothetical protein n=1 Tax=Catenulispora rubra TaxID=280293 RepID=UPI0018926F96|nr:hypothetical protein [Catenulispora rubra]